jgi:hypothetical protein
MQAYGRFWLSGQGFDLSLQKVLSAVLLTLGLVTFWTGFRFWLRSVLRKLSFRNAGFAIMVAAGFVMFWMILPERVNDDIAALVFPPPMVFMVGLAIPVAAFLFWRHHWRARDLAVLIAMTFGLLLGYRILFGMLPYAYAIFYNGPVLLGFFWLLFSIAIPVTCGSRDPGVRKVILLLCTILSTWVTVQVYPEYREMRKRRIAFETNRGMIYLPEAMLPAWAEAVDFMRHTKATGEAVMSIPEDTALYFFSGVLCPIRICIFHPGVVAPGPMMDQVIGEVRQAKVQYIIWSNRKFYEYGVSEFGVDFDIPFGEYIRRNYRPVREFGSNERLDGWQAILWERK